MLKTDLWECGNNWSKLIDLLQFVAVPRLRGQQLKDQAQLDGWYRDGSMEYVEGLL